MAKKINAYIKLQVKAGQANPSPPVSGGRITPRKKLKNPDRMRWR